MGKQFIVDGDGLCEVNHPLFSGGIDHGGEEHARAGVKITRAGRMNAQIFVGGSLVFRVLGATGAVHGEHASSFVAPKGGVKGVVVKDQNIARLGFQRHVAGKFIRRHTKEFLRVIDVDLLAADIMIGMLTAGDDAQTAGVTRQRVEVEGDLDRKKLTPVAVGVPARAAGVIVTIAAAIVKILANHTTD